jgi:hypothetical protein
MISDAKSEAPASGSAHRSGLLRGRTCRSLITSGDQRPRTRGMRAAGGSSNVSGPGVGRENLLDRIRRVTASGFLLCFLTQIVPCCFAGQPPTAVVRAQSAWLSTNSAFAAYLWNPPWVKSVRYVQSMDYFAADEPGDKEQELWVNATNEAAVQPTGMFIWQLTPAPFGPRPRKGDKHVVGVSSAYFWIADQTSHGLELSPRPPARGASGRNGTEIVVRQLRSDLERVRHFGLPAVRPHSFRLFSDGAFEAETSEHRVLRGKITAGSRTRPLALEYRFLGEPGRRVSVTYSYRSAHGALPSSFRYAEWRGGRLFRQYTNWTEKVRLGVDEPVRAGYRPSMFISNLDVLRTVRLWSNGTRYALTGQGRLRTVPDIVPGVPGRGRGHLAGVVCLLAAFAVLGAPVLMRALRQRGGADV